MAQPGRQHLFQLGERSYGGLVHTRDRVPGAGPQTHRDGHGLLVVEDESGVDRAAIGELQGWAKQLPQQSIEDVPGTLGDYLAESQVPVIPAEDGEAVLVPLTLDAAEAEQTVDETAISTLIVDALRADLAPDVPVALLYYTRPTDEQLVSASTWLDAVNPALGNIDQAIVDRTHELGLKTYVWTVNHGSDMNRGIDWGVDGIITDYPGVLVDVLQHRSRLRPELSPVRRRHRRSWSRWRHPRAPCRP